MVAKRGDPDAGVIICKMVKSFREVEAFIEVYSEKPEKEWRPLIEGEARESEIDARIAQEISFDRDLWVIEVEDPEGRHFLDF